MRTASVLLVLLLSLSAVVSEDHGNDDDDDDDDDDDTVPDAEEAIELEGIEGTAASRDLKLLTRKNEKLAQQNRLLKQQLKQAKNVPGDTADDDKDDDDDDDDNVLLDVARNLEQMQPLKKWGNVNKFLQIGVPALVQMQDEIAVFLQHAGRLAEARRLFESAAELAPQDDHASTVLGEFLFAQGEVELSEREFQRARRLRPDREMRWENVAQTMRQRGGNDETEALIFEALKGFALPGQVPSLPTPSDPIEKLGNWLKNEARRARTEENEDRQRIAAWIAGNYAMYFFIKSPELAATKGMDLSDIANDIWWADFGMWPWYCAVYERAFLPTMNSSLDSSQVTDKSRKQFVQRWAEEDKEMKKREASGPEALSKALAPIVQDMRKMECSGKFIHDLLKLWYAAGTSGVAGRVTELSRKDEGTGKVASLKYSSHNFWYGTFFLSSFMTMVEHPFIQPKWSTMVTSKSQFMVLGSNIGNEVFFGALMFGVETVGVEILCPLVDIAESLRKKHASDAPITFVCSDAMKADVSRAMVVYIDNEVWEEFLTKALFEKLGRELPVGAIVISYHKNVVMEPERWIQTLRPVTVEASWGDSTMYVMERAAEGSVSSHSEL